jgi:hypothetical protein
VHHWFKGRSTRGKETCDKKMTMMPMTVVVVVMMMINECDTVS